MAGEYRRVVVEDDGTEYHVDSDGDLTVVDDYGLVEYAWEECDREAARRVVEKLLEAARRIRERCGI